MTTIAELADERSVIICAGPGGVGKTTVAAALARRAARRGRRVCVVTIDPAKRLADALGLEDLTAEPAPVEGETEAGGQLWALMLDTKHTFDALVRSYSADEKQAAAILNNRFYRNISGALSGTQEYMAVEKLYELHESGRYDLVVVDTPPTTNALDFLDAPRRLTRFLNNRVFRVLMMPTRAGLRAVNVATRLFLGTISRIIGTEVVKDAVAFFTAFEGMEQGFRERASRVEVLLSAEETAYLIVAAARRDAVVEAGYLADRLRESSLSVSALVVNRMFPQFADITPDLAAGLEGKRDGDQLAAMVANLDQLSAVRRDEEGHVQTLIGHAPDAGVSRIPYLTGEVSDLAGLDVVADHLFGDRRFDDGSAGGSA